MFKTFFPVLSLMARILIAFSVAFFCARHLGLV